MRVPLVLFLLMVVSQCIGGCYNYAHFLFEKKKKQKLFPFGCVCVWVFAFVGLSHTTHCKVLLNVERVRHSPNVYERVFTHRFKEYIILRVDRQRECIGDIRKEESCSNDNSSDTECLQQLLHYNLHQYICSHTHTHTHPKQKLFFRGGWEREWVHTTQCVYVFVRWTSMNVCVHFVYDRLKRSIWKSTHSFLIYVHSICMGFKQNQKIYIFTPTNCVQLNIEALVYGVREMRRSSNATWLEFNAIATLQLRYVRESTLSLSLSLYILYLNR